MRWEIVNVALVGAQSASVLEMVRDIAQHEPDLLIVYRARAARTAADVLSTRLAEMVRLMRRVGARTMLLTLAHPNGVYARVAQIEPIEPLRWLRQQPRHQPVDSRLSQQGAQVSSAALETSAFGRGHLPRSRCS